MQHYLYDKGEYDPKRENAFAPALVNRIDRNTGGIVMAAKNAEALRILNQKVKDRELHKYYLCIVCGHLKEKEGLLTGYLEKNEAQNRVYVLREPKEGAKSHPHSIPGVGDAKGFLWWKWTFSPAGPIRSGLTLPPLATPWQGSAEIRQKRGEQGHRVPLPGTVFLQAAL